MSSDLELSVPAELSTEEENALESNINNLVVSLNNNRQEVNKLVFKSVSAMTATEKYGNELANKKGLARFIGSITGSNKALQDKINGNRSVSQYASQLVLKNLAERNLMTFDLVTVLNTKMNALIKNNNIELNKIYDWMGKLFKKNRSDICKLALRVDTLERNVKLLNWENSIEYQDYDGVEYQNLDSVTKIVCMVRDFYDITKGNWSTSDLFLLKKAMAFVGLDPRMEVNYFDVIKTIAYNSNLKGKLLGEKTVSSIENPEFLISSATLQRIEDYSGESHYLVETVLDILSAKKISVKDSDVIESLTVKYIEQKAQVNPLIDVETYDLMIDLLFNLQQLPVAGYEATQKIDIISKEFNDNDEKLALYKREAENGNLEAQLSLGEYFINDALEQDEGAEKQTRLKKLIQWYENPAKLGNSDAQNYLGDCYYYFYDDGTELETDDDQDQTLKKAFYLYTKAVEQNNLAAEYALGACYYFGKGVEEDPEKALYWYNKAAEEGNCDAQRELAIEYRDGDGLLKKNLEKSLYWWKKAAESGDTTAECELGSYYHDGIGVEIDFNEAVYWWKKAAEKDDGEAQGHLGNCYYNGDGVEKNLKKAVYWWKKAALQDDAEGQFRLGHCYYYGEGVCQSNEDAFYWLKQAAIRDNAIAQNSVGECYWYGEGVEENFEEAAYWFERSAEQGNAGGQRNLGDCYCIGRGVERDLEKALYWWKRAAENGDAKAQDDLGDCYYDGRGVERDLEKAVYWYEKAAEQGLDISQNKLGDCYRMGEGVEKDPKKAVYWYEKSAEQSECTFAQNNLGDCYRNGEGVEKNLKKAVYWYSIAAKHGNRKAQSNLGDCYRKGEGVEKDIEKATYWYSKNAPKGN